MSSPIPSLIPLLDTPVESPFASGRSTPRLESDTRHVNLGSSGPGKLLQFDKRRDSPKKIVNVDYDSDIDPDDLLPVYLESKAKLFNLQSATPKGAPVRSNGKKPSIQKGHNKQSTVDPESAKILRKLKRIEDDVLFDKYLADQQWEVRRIQLEKDAAAHRNAAEGAADENDSHASESLADSEDEVSREAAAIGAAMLEEDGSDDDAALADLFASLPVNEVDPLTGKSSTVVNGLNGVKVVIRDFGKWAGVNPARVLEEACRARLVLPSMCKGNIGLK
jgi:ATP-dependent RNA helicase DHX29